MNPNTPKSTPESKASSRPPRKSLAAWTLLLPALLLAGVVWQARQEPESTSAPATNDGVGATPTKKAAPAAVAKPIIYTLFIPGDDGELHRKIVKDPNKTFTREDFAYRKTELQTQVMTKALELLFQEAPESFPKGTRLLRPVGMDGRARVDLSKEFAANADSWSSMETLMRVYSIVNTVIETKEQVSGSESSEVLFLIEGKPISTLGELDASDAIEPDMSLVAKS